MFWDRVVQHKLLFNGQFSTTERIVQRSTAYNNTWLFNGHFSTTERTVQRSTRYNRKELATVKEEQHAAAVDGILLYMPRAGRRGINKWKAYLVRYYMYTEYRWAALSVLRSYICIWPLLLLLMASSRTMGRHERCRTLWYAYIHDYLTPGCLVVQSVYIEWDNWLLWVLQARPQGCWTEIRALCGSSPRHLCTCPQCCSVGI